MSDLNHYRLAAYDLWQVCMTGELTPSLEHPEQFFDDELLNYDVKRTSCSWLLDPIPQQNKKEVQEWLQRTLLALKRT